MITKQPLKQKRNLARDRHAFLEAIKSFPVQKIESDFDEQSANSLNSESDAAGIFLLGETHGVRENPNVIFTLFLKFGFKRLCLEWDKKLQAPVENFLATGKLNFNGINDSSDGRITAGYFALLKKLKKNGLLESLVCFDESSPDGDWDARDLGMAKNIPANLSGGKTLVVAGNLHAEVKPIIFGDEKMEHHPMGEILKKQFPKMPSGRIKYLSGRFYNLGVKEFKLAKDAGSVKAKFYRSAEGLYYFVLPEAHPAVVPAPNF